MIEKNLKILLAEDDLNLGFLLSEFLEGQGVDVKLFRDGQSAWDGFRSGEFNFCILDVMMPEMDGFSLAEKIRSIENEIPIIFLTARGMKDDKMKGYSIGADDYITKPFDEDELWCKIVAIGKRLNISNEPAQNAFEIGKYHFDVQNLCLIFDEQPKRLTMREAEVLKMLCLAKNNVVRREEILTRIWGENDYFAGRSLDVFISKLRKYFAADPEVIIENVIKVGYILKSPN